MTVAPIPVIIGPSILLVKEPVSGAITEPDALLLDEPLAFGSAMVILKLLFMYAFLCFYCITFMAK